MKDEIIRLRQEGYKYNEICEELGCSKGIVSYHCKINDLGGRIDLEKRSINDINDEELNEIKDYYKDHSNNEVSDKFNISRSSIYKICKNVDKNKSQIKGYKRIKSFRKNNKIKCIEKLGGRCSKCGYNKCIEALEFHHTDPDIKIFSISSNLNKAWSKIEKELEKCILVCANCHREIHNEL
jgi:DNA-binding CsgD family transcriptional regulator